MVKNMLYPKIAHLIKINMSQMKAAISCAFAPEQSLQTWNDGNVDGSVTLECIILCILCIVPRCLFRDVSVM